MSMFKWEVVDPAPGQPVAPDQRLAWGKTVGIGAQHVVAMFGATFVFPIIMGLDPNLAILMSGIATICFLLIVKGAVPSYSGTSASFVGGAAAIYAQQGGPEDVTGAILVSGVVLAICGVIIHFLGADVVNKALPPVVTGGVVMVIGFNLAGVATNIYMPADRWMAIITMTAVILMTVGPARLPRPDRDLPRPHLRLPALLDLRRHRRRRCRGRPRQLGQRQERRLVRLPSAHRRGTGRQPERSRQPRRGRLAPARLLDHLRAAGDARGDRADRREHGPRQGRGRHDGA